MNKFIKRVLRVRRIAENKAEREIVRRCGAKAGAYLRGLEIANTFGIAGECTPHEMALAVADSHSFTRHGSDRTWSGKVGGNDYKDRKRQTACKAINKANVLADKNIRSERLAARKGPATMVRLGTKAPRIQVYRG